MNIQIPICYYKQFHSEMYKLQFHPYVTAKVLSQRKIWKSPTGPSTCKRCKYCLNSLNKKTQWKGIFRRLMQKLKDNIQIFINISRFLRYKFRTVPKAELFVL